MMPSKKPLRRLPAFLAALSVVLAILSASSPAEEPGAAINLPTGDTPRYFGLYFQGHKVGWMSTRLSTPSPNEYVMLTESDFSLTVAGTTTKMKNDERRSYDVKSGLLKRLDYRMAGLTGETRLAAVVRGGELVLTSHAGGREITETLPFGGENIRDALAVEIAIREGRIGRGTEITSRSFDPSIKRNINIVQRIEGGETLVIHGVRTPVIQVTGSIVELGAPLTSFYDERGELIETLVAGFLKARWEDEATAKSGRSVADFIETSIIKAPEPIVGGRRGKRLLAVFRGVPENLAINTGRQSWRRLPDGARELVVTKESLEDRSGKAVVKAESGKMAVWLKGDSRVQTGDPAIIARAEELKKAAKDKTDLARRILDWVFDNVSKRYTPTFSNASEVMQTRIGDCGEHAVLFVALARAAGLPAREVAGIVYSDDVAGFGFHAWSEVWLGRWVSVDPSWKQFPADPTHIAFARGGIEEQVRVIALIGSLKVEKLSLELVRKP